MSGLTIDWLRQQTVIDSSGAMPLHAQLRHQLREVIKERFNDGDRFFGEVQIGEALGVSQTTVRRALSDLVDEGLLERQAAKGTFVLKPGNSDISSIIAIVPDFESSLNARYVEALSEGCKKRKISLALYSSHRGEATKHILQNTIRDPGTHGFILIGGGGMQNRRLATALQHRGQQVVVVDVSAKRADVSQYRVDNEAGIDLALQHVTELGHRRCVMWCGQPSSESVTRHRITVFQRLSKRYNLAVEVLSSDFEYLAPRSVSAFFPLVDRILDIDPRPTAVIADSDPAAAIILQRLSQRGLVCPRDISIVGFNGDSICELMLPRLTTVAIPVAEIINNAIDALIRRKSSETVLSQPTLQIRESTAVNEQEQVATARKNPAAI